MKKIISILLIICTLTLCLNSCGDSSSTNNADGNEGSKEHTVHDTTNGKCSVCGIDYFDILRAEILAKGTETEVYGTIRVKYSVNGGSIVFTATPGEEDTLTARYYTSPGSDWSDMFTLYMGRKHVKYGEYSWYFDWNYGFKGYYEKTISGTLVASNFKETTHSLEIESGSNISGAENQARYATDKVIRILEAISTILESCEYDISLKHFGFSYFD